MTTSILPIDKLLPELLHTFCNRSNIILHAPPGAGKTTRVPIALLDIIPASAGKIVMLEPRRLAAVSAARWMSRSLGERLGMTVGYSIRFDSCYSSNTRIEVVTEGILTRRLQNDPLLEGVAVVIFDEFHERSIHADLGLALCLEVQRQVRNDLRILVMSATLECELLAQMLGDAPVLSSDGKSFSVDEVFLEDLCHGQLSSRIVTATLRALSETEGDILVFLPGAGEIQTCARHLSEAGITQRGISIHPLYGNLPFEQQQEAILPGKLRKVVLATSIAETSLTIEGVRTVIDCGLSRRLRYDQGSGMNRLVTLRESKASAKQRKGRAGRLAPGVCYRLFGRHTYQAMTPQSPPEILESDLSPLLLELAAWGIVDPFALSWLDPPSVSSLSNARKLLTDLSAIDNRERITLFGRAMNRLPLHPRLARLLLKAQDLGCLGMGSDIASLLSEKDIICRSDNVRADAGHFISLADRIDMLWEWRESGFSGKYADGVALKAVDLFSNKLQRLLGSVASISDNRDSDCISRLLLAAYPDRIAKLREVDGKDYLLANGRGARLAFPSVVKCYPLLIAVIVNSGDQGEGKIYLSEPVSEEVLREELGHKILLQEEIVWSTREERIIAVKNEFIDAVILSSKVYLPKTEDMVTVIIEAIRDSKLGLLSINEDFLQIQARVFLLRQIFPEDAWPDLTDVALLESLEKWLLPFVIGVRSAQQLSAINCATALLSILDYRQQRKLDELAPTHLIVPSGSRIKLDYCIGEVPILAVKVQELFGLGDTPTIANGRVAVVLHLLSPAGRPIQVTQNLKGFWKISYHQVKKELKGRYPKHSWPEDPLSALPTRRAKLRGT